MFKRYKTKNAKIGARALKRYHKSQRRKKFWNEKEWLVALLLNVYALFGAAVMFITESTLLGILVIGLCWWLTYMWLKGRIL